MHIFYNTFQNALNHKLKNFSIFFNIMILKILYIFWTLGFIYGFSISIELFKKISIFLKYKKNKNILQRIFCISKPGRRVYVKYKQILKLPFGLYSILSTNCGIFNNYFCSYIHIGGECLVIVY